MFSSFLKLKDPSEKKAVTPNVQYVRVCYLYTSVCNKNSVLFYNYNHADAICLGTLQFPFQSV